MNVAMVRCVKYKQLVLHCTAEADTPVGRNMEPVVQYDQS